MKPSARPLLVLHPYFFALFPLLSLLAHNAGQARLVDAWRALLVIPLVVTVLLALGWAAVRDWRRAGLAVSLLVGLFFSFRYVYVVLMTAAPGAWYSRSDVLAALWSAGLILLPWLALRRLPGASSANLAIILNVMGAGALVFSSLYLVVYAARNLGAVAARGTESKPQLSAPASTSEQGSQPDIYYIILDGYGRDDVLRDLYGIPQNPFTRYLVEQGFYVADESHSNYNQTSLSLSTSLNFSYLDALTELRLGSNDLAPVAGLIQQNEVYRLLKAEGYRTVSIASGYYFTEIEDSDVYLHSQGGLNRFEAMLLSSSMMLVWMDRSAPERHRQHIHTIFDQLSQVPEIPGPKFVYAHIVIPHPPFVFDREGGPVEPFGSGDGQYYYGTLESYLTGYREQLLYTNRLAEQAVRAILAQSSTPPVIIIQGDHGPGAYTDFESQAKSCLRERFSILNAYYLPGVDPDAKLYPTVTPVNTFRVILNTYFDRQIELLPDRSYYSTWSHPYRFSDVSGQLDQCAPLAGAAP